MESVYSLGTIEIRVERLEVRDGYDCTNCQVMIRVCVFERGRPQCDDFQDSEILGTGPVLRRSGSQFITEENGLGDLMMRVQVVDNVGSSRILIGDFTMDMTSLDVARSVYTSSGFETLVSIPSLRNTAQIDLFINARIYCQDNYYGVNCMTFCRDTDAYTCDAFGSKNCTVDYTGEDCYIVSPCRTYPCLNGGSCSPIQTANGYSFRCTCDRDYSGDDCSQGRDDCASNPCRNNGTCSDGIGSFVCICAPGITGDRCEDDINECEELSPCRNGATCLNTLGSYVCQCPREFTGKDCQTKITNPCSPNPCVNGECYSNGDNFICNCPRGFIGNRCDQIDRCTSSPCLNNGECNTVGNSFTCTCDPGYSGTTCNIYDPCYNSPCENGVCSRNGVNYVCRCQQGYVGRNCDVVDTCGSSPCFNGGSCVPSVTSQRGYSCICAQGYTGTRYPCTSNTCDNGGTCRSSGSSFICECRQGYSGGRCQFGPCSPRNGVACFNGGTCLQEGSSYTCECPDNFTGPTCQIATSCRPGLCQNGGVCFSFSATSFNCSCPNNYTGQYCERHVCASFPCANSGFCFPDPSNARGFDCSCLAGYTGDTCEDEIRQNCGSNPCQNGGECVTRDFVSGYSCLCLGGFTGPNCEREVNACSSQPCLNGGRCVFDASYIDQYRCNCPVGFGGADLTSRAPTANLSPVHVTQILARTVTASMTSPSFSGTAVGVMLGISGETVKPGQILVPTIPISSIESCQSNPCVNGGECSSLSFGGYICTCPRGFAGINCQYMTSPACSPQPCLNGGSCTPSPDSPFNFTCSCPLGFGGQYCQIPLSTDGPCKSSPCRNLGTCVPIDSVAYRCECLNGYVGDSCQIRNFNCTPNRCPNGICYLTQFGEVDCMCPPLTKGRRCEQVDFKCPRGAGGEFPHPWDCSLWIHCDWGRAWVKDCPADLHFSRITHTCDFWDRAGCAVKPSRYWLF
ncbi:fibropellin-1-like [Haliotis rubra]|uniref:fibropellin-1-like n=1 Tax=Haliotis rubra TaxID=36100 RepID=UPI001EE53543|nr:fibropellin-1-like [Haliotis rubra]